MGVLLHVGNWAVVYTKCVGGAPVKLDIIKEKNSLGDKDIYERSGRLGECTRDNSLGCYMLLHTVMVKAGFA